MTEGGNYLLLIEYLTTLTAFKSRCQALLGAGGRFQGYYLIGEMLVENVDGLKVLYIISCAAATLIILAELAVHFISAFRAFNHAIYSMNVAVPRFLGSYLKSVNKSMGLNVKYLSAAVYAFAVVIFIVIASRV